MAQNGSPAVLQAIIEDMIAEKIQKVEVHCWCFELEMWQHHDLQHHTAATMSSIIGIVSLAWSSSPKP